VLEQVWRGQLCEKLQTHGGRTRHTYLSTCTYRIVTSIEIQYPSPTLCMVNNNVLMCFYAVAQH
jgi:hypothetical protein